MASKKIEKIKDTLNELIHLELNNQILNLINDMCQLHLLKPHEELPDFTKEAVSKVQGYASRLPEILSGSVEERAKAVEELIAFKRAYSANCAAFYVCANKLNLSGEYGVWVREHLNPEAKAVAANTHMYSMAIEAVREYMEDYIEDAESEDETYMRMSEVLSKIPLRMSKEKYTDLLKKSFKAAVTTAVDEMGSAEGMVRLMRLRYFPDTLEEYAALSHPIKEETEAAAAKNIDKLPMNRINEYLGSIDALLDRLQQIISYLGIISNDINYLIAIFEYCLDIEALTEDDLLLKDAVYTCVNMIKNQDYELYAQALNDSTEEQIDDIYEQLFELEPKVYNKGLNEKLINSDKELFEEFGVYNHIKNLFNMELADELAGDEYAKPAADREKYIEETVDTLTKLAVSAPETVSPARNKRMRSAILSVLPVVMTKEEFFDYVDYAMEGAKGKVAGAIMLYELQELLINEDEEDFDEDWDFDDEDCGCGCHHDHDHNHDHGHDHNHNHSHLRVIKNNNIED